MVGWIFYYNKNKQKQQQQQQQMSPRGDEVIFSVGVDCSIGSLFFTSSLTIALVVFSLSLRHTVADMWPNRENAEEEPEWVKNERKQFVNYRDKNKDGRLDKTEVKDWILPDNFNHAQAESKHLVFETDVDKVCTLLHRKTCFFFWLYHCVIRFVLFFCFLFFVFLFAC